MMKFFMKEFQKKEYFRKTKNKGFSLVELLVAIILLAIIVTPIMNSFITTAKINRNARKIMVATDVAQNVLDVYSSKTFKTLLDGLGASGINLSGTNKFMTMNGDAYNTSSNWVNLSSDAGLTGAFTQVTPTTVEFVATNPAYSYSGPTKGLISENTITMSMNTLFMDRANAALTVGDDQRVYYAYIPSTDPNYTGEGLVLMYYTNIQGENGYTFDAVVSVIPTANDVAGEASYYFSYNTKVTLYDKKSGGEPMITLLGGMSN